MAQQKIREHTMVKQLKLYVMFRKQFRKPLTKTCEMERTLPEAATREPLKMKMMMATEETTMKRWSTTLSIHADIATRDSRAAVGCSHICTVCMTTPARANIAHAEGRDAATTGMQTRRSVGDVRTCTDEIARSDLKDEDAKGNEPYRNPERISKMQDAQW